MLCETELSQNGINPGDKSAYRKATDGIRNGCQKFTNRMNLVKTHFKKQPAPKRSSAKAKAAGKPKVEDEDDDDDV